MCKDKEVCDWAPKATRAHIGLKAVLLDLMWASSILLLRIRLLHSFGAQYRFSFTSMTTRGGYFVFQILEGCKLTQ